MAHKRSFSTRWSVDPRFVEASEKELAAALAFPFFWTHVDDGARIKAHPVTLKATLFPVSPVTTADISRWMDILQEVGLGLRYTVDGQDYFMVPPADFYADNTYIQPKRIFSKWDGTAGQLCGPSDCPLPDHPWAGWWLANIQQYAARFAEVQQTLAAIVHSHSHLLPHSLPQGEEGLPLGDSQQGSAKNSKKAGKHDPWDLTFVEGLWDIIKANHPTVKLPERDGLAAAGWAHEAYLMRTGKEKRTQDLMEWKRWSISQEARGNFWWKQVQSMNGFREHFDKLGNDLPGGMKRGFTGPGGAGGAGAGNNADEAIITGSDV